MSNSAFRLFMTTRQHLFVYVCVCTVYMRNTVAQFCIYQISISPMNGRFLVNSECIFEFSVLLSV